MLDTQAVADERRPLKASPCTDCGPTLIGWRRYPPRFSSTRVGGKIPHAVRCTKKQARKKLVTPALTIRSMQTTVAAPAPALDLTNSTIWRSKFEAEVMFRTTPSRGFP